ncbi:Fc.00g085050.m01.CDS01 [Cosmosporella sp. VM-42]
MAKQSSHLAALVPALAKDLVLEKRQTPTPGPNEVLIHNHAIAVNPIDWKRQASGFLVHSFPVVLGADISGVVAEVGPSVTAFKPGDRVIGFAHSFVSGNNDNGAHQEYTVTKVSSTAALPQGTSFLQGATLPTAVGTAAMALFGVLNLPRPSLTGETTNPPKSILLWGGASNVGFMAIQIARLAGLTVFAAASERHHAQLKSHGASVLVDYHSPTAVDDLVAAAKSAGTEISYAVDVISTKDTIPKILEVLSKTATGTTKIAHTTPWPEGVAKPEGLEETHIPGHEMWLRRQDLCAWLCNEALPKWLEQGDIVTQDYRVIEGGLGGLQNALNELKKGVSGEKLVVEL